MTQLHDIDITQLVDDVREVAAERPDYTYPSAECVYFWEDGTPACIVGHAFVRQGLTFEDVGTRWAGNSSDILTIFGEVLGQGTFNEHMTQLEWLQLVQHEQDCKATWSEAITNADQSEGT